MTIRRFTEQESAMIVDEYLAGKSITPLSIKWGCSYPTVVSVIQRAGHETRGRADSVRVKALAHDILERYRTTDESAVTIAKFFKVGPSTVRRVLDQAGIASRPAGIPLSRRKGWAWANEPGGYRMIMVESNDPFIGMARTSTNRHGRAYILEHRLIMARSLGRVLDSSETVHHINGDRTDNRPENLQVRSGRHGKGVRLQCFSCGSDNVGTVEL